MQQLTSAPGLKENKYGVTNEVLEQTDTLLHWTAKSEGQDEASRRFHMLVKLGDTTWLCTQGNYDGWTKAQAERQMEACKTLSAKE